MHSVQVHRLRRCVPGRLLQGGARELAQGLVGDRKDLEQVPYLVIDPDECIDGAVCIPECPANAIYAEDYLPEGMEIFLQFNKKLAPTLPTITKRKAALPDAEQWRVVSHKLSGLNIAL